jgi:hypothetical protein
MVYKRAQYMKQYNELHIKCRRNWKPDELYLNNKPDVQRAAR